MSTRQLLIECPDCKKESSNGKFVTGCPHCGADPGYRPAVRWVEWVPVDARGNGNNGATTKVESAVNATA